MPIQKLYIAVEMADGTVHEDVRITVQDKLRWSKTSRVNHWDPQDEVKAGVFLAWHALTRNNLYSGTYEQFEAEDVVDIADSEPETEVADAEDPTK